MDCLQNLSLPNELISKILMYSLPTYPYLDEIKTTRITFSHCDCEGCNYKPYFGCYNIEFNDKNKKLKKKQKELHLFSFYLYINEIHPRRPGSDLFTQYGERTCISIEGVDASYINIFRHKLRHNERYYINF
jgi:hypothetical protein